MKLYKWKDLSKKGKVILVSGAFVIAGSIVGCNAKKNTTSNEAPAVSTEAESNSRKLNDQTTMAEITTAEDTRNYDFSEYFDEIDTISDDVVNYINDGLAKGAYDFKITDEMKRSIARNALDYYLMMNQGEISGIAFDILNQKQDMNSIEMIDGAMTESLKLQEQAIISKENTVLDYKYLIKSAPDKALIQDLAGIIADMHMAIEKNDKETLDKLAKEVIEIKEGLKTNNKEYELIYKPMTIDLTLMLIDAADALYNGEIITDDEDLAQIFNTSFVKCIDGDYVSIMTDERLHKLAEEFKIEGYQEMTREEILEAISNLHYEKLSEVSIRSNERTIAKAIMTEILSETKIVEYKEEYIYEAIINRIASKIDLSKQVIPEENSYDVVNKNSYGPNICHIPGSTETHQTTPDNVPDEEKEPTTTVTIIEETGEETNEVYAEAMSAGRTAGQQAAVNDRSAYYGHSWDMPKKALGSQPSTTCTDYNTVYNYFFNYYYNLKVDEFAAADRQAIEENKQATTEFVPDEGPEKIIDEKTETLTTEQQTTEEQHKQTTENPTNGNDGFVPDEGEEEVIDEEVETYASLKDTLLDLRKQLVGAYTMAYVDNYYDSLENENAKRM